MTQKHMNVRRVLSMIMVFAMMLTMLPASVFSTDTGNTVYLKPNSNWLVDNARFAVCYWNDSGYSWVSMTDSDNDGYYEAVIPAGYSNIIFCRMNPSNTTNSWDTRWNQTSNLTVPTDGTNCYTVADGTWSEGGGTWSTYTPTSGGDSGDSTATYFVAGTSALCGVEWSANSAANQMTLGDDGLYSITYNSVYPGTHEFKITDGTWDNSWGTDGGETNYSLTLDAISDVTINFNADTKAITVSSQATGEVVEYFTCDIKLHLANTADWVGVCLYAWTSADGVLTGAWPGDSVAQDDDGYYTYSKTLTLTKNQALNFIFNNGGNGQQTFDLSVPYAELSDGKAEYWVQLGDQGTGDDAGKYNATLYTHEEEVVVSPAVDGTSVTFEYRNADATSVQVYGTMNSWASGYTMEKNDYGVWSVTIDNLTPATHRYKFLVDGEWILDPSNNWTYNETDSSTNSAFIVLDPDAKDTNQVTVRVHYYRSDSKYTGWNLWTWGPAMGGTQFDFATVSDEQVATITLTDARAHQSISFIPRCSTDDNDWEAQEATYTVNLSNIVSGTVDYYITSGNTSGMRVLNTDVKLGNKVSSAELDYDNGTVNITTTVGVSDPASEFTIVHNGTEIPFTLETNGTVYTLTLTGVTLDLVNLYQYQIKYDGYTYAIGINTVYASDKFAQEFTYSGTDLGAVWSESSTTFTVWAPTASTVSVKLYKSGTAGTDDPIKTVVMTAGENGVWTVTVEGDLNGTYYTYAVTRGGTTVEAVDPYARATGVNGKRGMVVDLDSTDPDGWDKDENPNEIDSYTDAIIYELHVRDFSIDDSSGILEDYQGKFLAFTQTGTTVDGVAGGLSTGIDYLKSLGVTHIHLLPVYDYGSVDETKCENFNWGYDPVNYNVPEGSYSTDPYSGKVRVEEFKQMVMALHKAGISVIMDVVYNHVYDADAFCFNQIVPGYFSRVNSNRSGCGNDTASEREMVSKYIVESVTYWCEEYHIDGFRFDLVGLIDVDTINAVVDSIHDGLGREDVIFYGEGWDMDTTNKEAGTEMAKQGNADKTPEFGYFSDSMRNLLGGENGSTEADKLGFVTGLTTGKGSDLASNFLGKPWWTTNPSQVIQYASCHDNYTLIDKLVISTGASGITSDIISMNNLAAAFYMTSAGIPFIHAGEEMLREKIEEDGGRCENSYNASDYVNHIEWSNLEKTSYADTLAYYQGLIAFRKAHAALRYDTAWEVQKYIKTVQVSDTLMVFHIDGYGADDQDICIIFNAGTSSQTVALPAGTWSININKADAGTTSLGTATGSVSVDGISAMVLTQDDTGENAAKETVTLFFVNNLGWEQVYAYAWDSNGNYLTNAWPGTAMTYVETNDYDEDIYALTISADASQVVFNNNSGAQTVDLTIVPGYGYYCQSTTDASGYYECGTYEYSVTTGSASDFYLFGYINGANYGCEDDYTNLGKYLFVDGTVTATFDTDSYVGVKTGDNGTWYMTNGYLGYTTSASLYDSNALTNADKLLVPGGVKVTFTLTKNKDGSLTLSYIADLSSGSYDDKSGIQDGVTLHCWNWSFAQIEANMAKIAEMGFTAIQTSPVQPIKESTLSGTVNGNWWVYYQPVDFVITTDSGNILGTKEELESMIKVAHTYGIQVIVDVVANHLGNEIGNDLSPAIPEWLRTNTACWHTVTTNITDYTNRQDVTQNCMGGLPDLNTGNDDVQTAVLKFLRKCVDIGVDGFRFDAAKHIETPNDGDFASDFWPTVINGVSSYAATEYSKNLYFYGEVLDSTNGFSISDYTVYMSVTDNQWGNALRENISSGTAALSGSYYKAADASNLVLWAESHDTYANDDGASKDESVAEINLTWALVAARANAMSLYLSRPTSNDQLLGTASTIGWYTNEVKAVNQFHNTFAGHSETLGNSGTISYVVRSNCGIVMVNAKGTTTSVSFSVPMADGTYRDQISGNTFTVKNGKISGQIGNSGIAVVYVDAAAAIDDATFDTVQKAIAAAEAGDTIVLLRSTSTTAVELLEGVTLDLHGYTLIVDSHVLAYSDNCVIDSVGGGLLRIDRNRLMLQKDNGYLPIWNGDDGYMLANCGQLADLPATGDNTASYTFLPYFSPEAYELLAAGADTTGVTMKVQVSWTGSNGKPASTTFTFSDELIKDVSDSHNGTKFTQAFKLELTGTDGKTLSYKVYFESDTGVLLECGS